MDEREFIDKNNRYIWKHVRAFSIRNQSDGNFRCDMDDLYQECVLHLLKKLRKAGDEEIRVSGWDLQHVMYAHVQRMLPVHVPHNTGNYTRDMRTYKSVSGHDKLYENYMPHVPTGDLDYSLDIRALASRLSPRDRKVFRMLSDGFRWTEIGECLGLDRAQTFSAKRRIGKAYNRFMGEAHGASVKEKGA